MNEPKISFKNVKTFRGMDGYGINADVYINGVKCMFIYDSGDGGEMNFDENIHGKNPKQVVDNIKLLKDYIEQLPKKEWKFEGETKFLKVTMEDYFNDKLVEMEEEKNKLAFQKKMVKLFETAIVIGVPNSGKYQYLNYKRQLNTLPVMYLKNQIENVRKKYCTDGVEILNTNLKHVMG